VLHLPGWKSPIRAVFFDAVGTLIHPDPPAAAAYRLVGERFGSRISGALAERRFREAFARQEELDRAAGCRTSEEREHQRWRAIVAEVLDDVADRDGCFHELFAHFARPGSWRITEDAPELLDLLAREGCVLGVCSNFDSRLREVLAGLPELALLRELVISSEVGWRKPAPEYYAALTASVGLGPQEILIVGDDLVNDAEGATLAGLAAILYDPRGRHAWRPRLTRLSDLPALCGTPGQRPAGGASSLWHADPFPPDLRKPRS
jgi:putative hydrolase of the HAD superfamily